jgi:5-enolpyruvylshikimate-3-phosphate synthase
MNEKYTIFNSYGDHRIAMTFGILSMLNKAGSMVKDFDCVGISNPNFINQIKVIVEE